MNKDCCEKCIGAGFAGAGHSFRKIPVQCVRPDCPCHNSADDVKRNAMDDSYREQWSVTDTAEKKCDSNCLTFIKNGFCLHTGYPTTDTSDYTADDLSDFLATGAKDIADKLETEDDTSDWRERFDAAFIQDKDPNDRVNGWLARDNGNGTVSIARPEDLKAFIEKELERVQQPITATEIALIENNEQFVRKAKAQFSKKYFDEGVAAERARVREVIAVLGERKTNALQQGYEKHVLRDLLEALSDK